MSKRSFLSRIVVFTLALSLQLSAFAANEIGKPSSGGSSFEWETHITGHETIKLTVIAPDGEAYVKEFGPGRNPSFRIADLGGLAEDGQYTYELRVSPKLSADVKKRLADARAANDEAAIRKITKEAKLGNAVVQSGVMTILNGFFVSPNGTEPGSNDVATMSTREIETDGVVVKGRRIEVQDQVIPDDLIVQGSICAGFDCVDNESFGSDTLKLKENNLRIFFEDTSVTAGYATNDWRIIANGQGSGGAEMFAIEDSTAARNPFQIEAAAPASALYVDSTGNIGFSQSAPLLDLHITTSDTPAMRLEQSNAGGFTAQTWDIGANEANFFVRDLTGGSRLPFRIRPGAPTSSIDIAASGKVGMGTASPSERLHVFENADVNSILLIQNSNAGTTANATLRAQSDTSIFDVKMHSSTRTITRFGKTLGGWAELLSQTTNGAILGTLGAQPLILGTNATNRLEIGGTGGVTVTGNFTVTGGTKNFAVVDPANSSKAIYFAALEGPEAGTYFRGTAKTVDGVAVIDLPGHFSRITENERMTVQLTPVGAAGQLYVVKKSPQQVTVKVAEGGDDIEFDFLVQGIRLGYLDFEVERENNLPGHNQ
ncbi:MAG TPA: hypothetical protein VF846_11515 [Thermoanaerobaculia bacterium]|jgi:hypothetical protein